MEKHKQEFIQAIGEAVYKQLQLFTEDKYLGQRLVIPIGAHFLFQDGNHWMSTVTVTKPHFVFQTGHPANPEFKTMTLDEYMGWLDEGKPEL